MSDFTFVKIPKVYENMDEGTLVQWFVDEGDEVTSGQILADLVTDKMNAEIEAPCDGTILKLYQPEKSNLPIGAHVAVIGEAGTEAPINPDEAASQGVASKAPKTIATPPAKTTPCTSENHGKVKAAPPARILAKKMGIDLAQVANFVGGRTVHKKDVEAYHAQIEQQTQQMSVQAIERTVLITGASGAIGEAIAQQFLQAGWKLILLANQNTDRIESWLPSDDQRYQVFKVDLMDKEAITSFVQNCPPLDALICNAGALFDSPIAFMQDDAWEQAIQLNLSAPFYLARGLAMNMIRKKAGRMVFITSDAGRMGAAARSNYAAAKAGLAGFARSLAREMANSNIQVNSVSPGFVDSPMTASLPERRKQDILKEIPMRRFGEAAEVANLVHYLIVDAPAYLTGQEISLDGGLYMG
ncbi:MAG: SDR family oxidoreductase [Lentisphaeria bacterium]|nr:SDR family oxidoreductase [Lentisphaeria bacterium]